MKGIRHILEIDFKDKNELGLYFINKTVGFETLASLIEEYIRYPVNEEY